MAELQQFRDHARHMAGTFDGSRRSAPCAGRTFADRGPNGPRHDWCPAGLSCTCECHEPTAADRALWQQLADEIDAHLNRDTDEHPELG